MMAHCVSILERREKKETVSNKSDKDPHVEEEKNVWPGRPRAKTGKSFSGSRNAKERKKKPDAKTGSV